MMAALRLDAAAVRADAKLVLAEAKTLEGQSGGQVLALGPNTILGRIFATVRANRFFKYTDAWGIGY